MTRSELIRRMVLNAIADDYEIVDQIILPQVAKDCDKLGLEVERSEIVKALGELVAGGLAKAYLLSSTEPCSTELQGMPKVDIIEEDFKTYFYITRKGMDSISPTTLGGPSTTPRARYDPTGKLTGSAQTVHMIFSSGYSSLAEKRPSY
jgi:hypothetical protein